MSSYSEELLRVVTQSSYSDEPKQIINSLKGKGKGIPPRMFDNPSFSTCSENSKRSWDQALRASRRDLCIDLDSTSDSGAESPCKSKKTDIFTAEASKGSG